MLPTEAFAEAVAFLRLFDLNALAVTNNFCSSLAVKASTRIRWEEFPGLVFCIDDTSVSIYRHADASKNAEGYVLSDFVAHLTFASKNDTVNFVAAAFPNCIFEQVTPGWVDKNLLYALDQVAGSVVIKGILWLSGNMSHDDSLHLVRKFRKIKTLQLAHTARGDEVNAIANFYRDSGIQELYCCRSIIDWTPKKLAVYF